MVAIDTHFACEAKVTTVTKPQMNERMIWGAGEVEVDNSNAEGEPFKLVLPDEDEDVSDDKTT